MSIKLPDDKLDVIKLITTQHIRYLNEKKNAKLNSRKLSVEQLLELLGFHRPEAGPADEIPIDEEPEGWLCNVDDVCGFDKA